MPLPADLNILSHALSRMLVSDAQSDVRSMRERARYILMYFYETARAQDSDDVESRKDFYLRHYLNGSTPLKGSVSQDSDVYCVFIALRSFYDRARRTSVAVEFAPQDCKSSYLEIIQQCDRFMQQCRKRPNSTEFAVVRLLKMRTLEDYAYSMMNASHPQDSLWVYGVHPSIP